MHNAFSALLDVVSNGTPAGHADAAKPKGKLASQDDVPSMPPRLLLVHAAQTVGTVASETEMLVE